MSLNPTNKSAWPVPDQGAFYPSFHPVGTVADDLTVSIIAKGLFSAPPPDHPSSLNGKDIIKKNIYKEEFVLKTLTLILSDHLDLIIESAYQIFLEALTHKESGPKLAPHILTLFTLGTSKLLPKSFHKLEDLPFLMKPDKIEKHAPIFLNATKALIDDIFSDQELKAAFVLSIARTLTPFFLEKTIPVAKKTFRNKDLSKHQKNILAAFDGLDSYFSVFTKTMDVKGTWGYSADCKLLDNESSNSYLLESFLLGQLKEQLRKKGSISSDRFLRSHQPLGSDLYATTKCLIMSLFPTVFKKPEEQEALVVLSSFCLAKFAEALFSPRTLMHLFDKLLHGNLVLAPSIQENTPLSEREKCFVQELHSKITRVILKGTKMSTSTRLLQLCFDLGMRLYLIFKKKQIDEFLTLLIRQSSQSSALVHFLAILREILYHPSHENIKTPVLKRLYTDPEDDIQKKKKFIESSLNKNLLYHKIMDIYKGLRLTQNRQERSSRICRWLGSITHSNFFKSLYRNLFYKLYIVSQRDRLLKMLYCYIAETIHHSNHCEVI